MRVATNLTKELCAQGHDVQLWSGSRDYPLDTALLDGARVRLFPARVTVPALGFATTVALGHLRAIYAERHRIDGLHIHLARDFVTLPAVLLAKILGIPYIVQTHGMIVRKTNPIAVVFDALLTRPALRGAKSVLCLTALEQSQLREMDNRLDDLPVLANGIHMTPGPPDAPANEICEVLFLARMAARKRPQAFVRSAVDVLNKGREATFRLVGPDENEVDAVNHEIDSAKLGNALLYEGALPPDRTSARIAQCDVYVLPSVDEPFGMSVLEAMERGKPVIITDSCGLAPYIKAAGAGLVVDASREALTEAMDKLVLSPDARQAMGTRARNLVRQEFDIRVVAKKLSQIYAKSFTPGKPGDPSAVASLRRRGRHAARPR
ncbi:glycosyltransferase [Kocuria rosea]|uniref:glycosyltransferase n=1 Tax=Kocuria rosea TaxID=1275 RepID=UPI0022B1DFD4|nr:glycosyltransferase [Kocuria polaris]